MNLGPYQPNTYVVGDCRALLRQLPDLSINCCVTSPPYWGLRDYGEPGQLGLEATPAEYVANMVEVFREVRRVLRDDGTAWINLGDSYNAYNGNAGPGSGFSSGAACDTERPHLKSGHGLRTCELKPKDLVGIPWRVAFALQADGWYLRSEIIWHKPNPMPESVTDRPTKSHEQVFLLAKSESYFYDAAAIAEPCIYPGDHGFPRGPIEGCDSETVAWRAKSQQDRKLAGVDSRTAGAETRNRRTVWTIPTQLTPDAHFATFPEKLVEPCILAGCPAGGIVLDPFGGSGTVGRVAEDLGRKWLLFDLSAKYAEIAKRKTAQTGLLGRCKPAPPPKQQDFTLTAQVDAESVAAAGKGRTR